MTTITPEIRMIGYNPATRAFEARVTILDAGARYTYPCALRAPLNMDTSDVSRRLVEMARRRHARDHRPVHAHRPETILSDHVPDEVTQATSALWQKMLRPAA